MPVSHPRGPSVAERNARKKAEPGEVVEQQPEVVEETKVPEVEDDFLGEPVNQEEFNEFVKTLVTTLVDERLAGYDERIRDLETLLTAPGFEQTVTLTPEQMPSHGGGIPEYRPPSERNDSGSATPWYH